MFELKEVIIVEGIYDKIKLSGFIKSPIYITNGFGVFNSKDTQRAIRTFAKTGGIVILTDSDFAGIKIRAFVKQLVTEGIVLDAYIPEIFGKERRKRIGGKEGLLGVEGICESVIMEALRKSGAEICGEKTKYFNKQSVTKSDFYKIGISGQKNSEMLRKQVLEELNLPSKLSSNMLLQTVNRLLTKDEFIELVKNIKEKSAL